MNSKETGIIKENYNQHRQKDEFNNRNLLNKRIVVRGSKLRALNSDS